MLCNTTKPYRQYCVLLPSKAHRVAIQLTPQQALVGKDYKEK